MKAAIVLVRRADGGQIVAFNVGSLIGEPIDFLATRALAAFSCRMKTGRGEQCFYRETQRKSMNFCFKVNRGEKTSRNFVCIAIVLTIMECGRYELFSGRQRSTERIVVSSL